MITTLLFVRQHPFWLTDFTYRFPLIGKLARFSGDHTEHVSGSWLNVELNLCRDYSRHANSMRQSDFGNHVEYLRKAHDLGRRPMPILGFALITILVIFEGLAFAYILGSWISVDSTANERIWFMLATVSVLAVLLVSLTHAAGRQLHRTKVLQACFRAWKESHGKRFFTRVVSLADDQKIDDSEPTNVQCANRVAAHERDFGSYILVWLAILFIAVIAVGATTLRLSTLETSGDAALLANLFGEFGASDAQSAGAGQPDRTAAFVSFGILGVIFVVTQFVAISFGYKYGFAGRESAHAYDELGGHTNYRSYWRGIQHRMNIANLRLKTLQRLLEQRSGPIDWHKNFFDFVREERAAGNTNLNEPPSSPDSPTPPAQEAAVHSDRASGDNNVTPIDRNAS
jgi:hypothetical protein